MSNPKLATDYETNLPSSPFWLEPGIPHKPGEPWISDPAYFREAMKGFAEQLNHADWKRIYDTILAGVKEFMARDGFNVNSQNEAFHLGLCVGKAMLDVFFRRTEG